MFLIYNLVNQRNFQMIDSFQKCCQLACEWAIEDKICLRSRKLRQRETTPEDYFMLDVLKTTHYDDSKSIIIHATRTVFYLVVRLFWGVTEKQENRIRTNLADQRRVTIQKSQNRKNYDNNYKGKNFRKSFPKKSRFSFLATGRLVDFSDFWKS